MYELYDTINTIIVNILYTVLLTIVWKEAWFLKQFLFDLI